MHRPRGFMPCADGGRTAESGAGGACNVPVIPEIAAGCRYRRRGPPHRRAFTARGQPCSRAWPGGTAVQVWARQKCGGLDHDPIRSQCAGAIENDQTICTAGTSPARSDMRSLAPPHRCVRRRARTCVLAHHSPLASKSVPERHRALAAACGHVVMWFLRRLPGPARQRTRSFRGHRGLPPPPARRRTTRLGRRSVPGRGRLRR